MIITQPPRGLQAKLYRLPIWIYRFNLGWIFGRRALLLNHTGRKTGKARQAVIEIIDSKPEQGQYYVVSGFGTHSQWFKNIQQDSCVSIQVGSKKMLAEVQILDPDQAEEVFLGYTQRNPQVIRMLAKWIGYDVPHNEESYRAFGRKIPIIRFVVRDGKSDEFQHVNKPENNDLHYQYKQIN